MNKYFDKLKGFHQNVQTMNSYSLLSVIKKVTTWFEDSAFRKLFKNAFVLLTGNIGTAALDLISFAIMARALGPSNFGILILIFTYVKVIDILINFQSWQAIVKYGADSQVDAGRIDFARIIKFGTVLDAFSAAAGTLIAIAGIGWFSHWKALDADTSILAYMFTLYILFNLRGTPTAVLQLFDQFKLMAGQRLIAAFIKLIFFIVAFLTECGLFGFCVIWVAMFIFDHLSLLALGWHALHREGYSFTHVLKSSLRKVLQKFPGIVKFVISTNFTSSVRLVVSEVDILLVGIFFGTSDVGIYKVATQFGTIPAKFAFPLQQSLYPEVAKLWATGAVRHFRMFILRIGMLSGAVGIGIWLFFLVFGNLVLDLTVGHEFSDAYLLLLIYMSGYLFLMFGVVFRPAVLSMEHADRILVIYIGASIVYTLTLVVLIMGIGLIGAAIAQVVFHFCWFAAMSLSIVGFLRTHAKLHRDRIVL